MSEESKMKQQRDLLIDAAMTLCEATSAISPRALRRGEDGAKDVLWAREKVIRVIADVTKETPR